MCIENCKMCEENCEGYGCYDEVSVAENNYAKRLRKRYKTADYKTQTRILHELHAMGLDV